MISNKTTIKTKLFFIQLYLCLLTNIFKLIKLRLQIGVVALAVNDFSNS